MNKPEVYGRLDGWDFSVITAYLVFSMFLGLVFARRGTKDADAYFIGGRGMPWWLIGISLAATCFAADTPLWIGDMIYKRGIEGTWLHWVTAIGFSFYVFTIAPLWRRSRIITDLEFLELRYSGKAAAWLRGINSVYFSLFFNVMMMGVGILSITTIMQSTTGWDKAWCVLITMAGALIYCVVSGLWGVAATDFMQFFVAFLGSAILAGVALWKVGGTGPLIEYLSAQKEWAGHQLNVMPGTGAATGLPMMTILFLFLFRWQDNASIGAYVSQRLFAARSVRHATLGAMLHAFVYWSIVPTPWIITITASKMLMPHLTNGQEAYPRMAMAVLPSGLKGILIASMLAAFMSTYSSLLSWGSSYAVNDLYRRFLVRNARPKHYVRIGQGFMIPMAIISALIAYRAESIFNLLTYIFFATSGIVTVQVARWLWWRVNAWAEVAALGGSILLAIVVIVVFPAWVAPETNEIYLGHKMLFVTIGALIIWVVTMFLTKPTDADRLDAFVRRVNPPGFWGEVRRRTSVTGALTWPGIFYGWAIMLVAIYGPVIGLMKLFFGHPRQGMFIIGIGIVGMALAIHRALGMKDEADPEDAPSL